MFVSVDVLKRLREDMRAAAYEGHPRLCLFARRDILKNEEILYDYGITKLPWENNSMMKAARWAGKLAYFSGPERVKIFVDRKKIKRDFLEILEKSGIWRINNMAEEPTDPDQHQ